MIDTLLQLGVPLAVAAFALTLMATRRVLTYLRDKQILDLPNDRSSHSLATPRGGGLATTPVLAGVIAVFDWRLALGAVFLLAVSWIDDRKGLPALPRFAAHGLCVAGFLMMLPDDQMVFQGGFPLWLDRFVTGICWLWFVNLYNFMDGIDGITGAQTVCLGLGIALVGGAALAPPALAAAAVGGGFLIYNWHPAKLFMGDSGSVPLGYVLGGLLILMAVQGHLIPALILPAYYLADATITLIRRALNGEKIWQAHRKHFYQRAVQGGKRHDQVVLLIAAGNAALIGAALIPAGWAAATAIVAVMLAVLRKWSKGDVRA